MPITVRARGKDGMFRVQVEPQDDFSVLLSELIKNLPSETDASTLTFSSDPKVKGHLASQISGSLDALGISHGSLLFLEYQSIGSSVGGSRHEGTAVLGQPSAAKSATPANTSSGATSSTPIPTSHLTSVDAYWTSHDGRIPREKGKNGCVCGPKAMCDRCAPLEPYDAEYHTEHGIKHLSYYAYLKKLSSAGSAPSTPSYRVQVPCAVGNHAPWPEGICSHCQPSAITLVRQPYRMVDHVEFADPQTVDGLISYWRSTGCQRLGLLVGHYEPYEDVPMGIKAVVEAVYEPPQENFPDGLQASELDLAGDMVRLVESLGLTVVGVIFTDLRADPDAPGKVVHKRNATTSFSLSSLEVVFAATLQARHKTFSSSRFVTCVVSGDAEGQIGVEAYQVSDQAVGMVEADLVEPSVDPSVLRVKPETDAQTADRRYVPDVFFRHKNEYGYEVQENAKPCFPIDYLLVNVSHGFPKQPNPLFTAAPFAIEHRDAVQRATLSMLSERIQDTSLAWLSEFHLLVYLLTLGLFSSEDIYLMARTVAKRDTDAAAALSQTPSWLTLIALVSEAAPVSREPEPQSERKFTSDGFEIPPDVDVPPDADPISASTTDAAEKICAFCTFANAASATDCEMCGLPLNG